MSTEDNVLRYGVLDASSFLVGYQELTEEQAADRADLVPVDAECDLPADGSYKWMDTQGCFFPLGKGFGQPERTPVQLEHVMYLLIRAMQNGTVPPAECGEWADWYEKNLLQAQEERKR